MSDIIKLYESLEFPKQGILSRKLFESASGEIDLFTIPAGHKISGHTSSRDAAVQIVKGEAEWLLGEEWHKVKEGDTFYMPAGLIHAITAVEDLAFLLTLFGARS